MTQLIQNLTDISPRYDALFVDLWGCVHNGVTAYPEAVKALQSYRKSGGIVILVTNSPRPWKAVSEQLIGFGVPTDAYDAIATSGDSARRDVSGCRWIRRVFYRCCGRTGRLSSSDGPRCRRRRGH